MKKTNYLLLSALLLTVGGLFTATRASAELFTPASGAPPRICNLGTSVTIVAGVNGDETAAFPRVVICPSTDCPADFIGTGPYLRWDYKFYYNGVNSSAPYSGDDEDVHASNVFLSVSDDTQLFFVTPAAAISTPLCAGDSQSRAGLSTCEVRFLRFNANASTFDAAYLTSLGWAPRIATAGAKVGHSQQFCLLAGAGMPTGETGQSITHVSAQTPGCNYEFDAGPGAQDIVMGSLHTVPPNNPDCTIQEDNTPPLIDGQPTSGWHTGILEPPRTIGSCNYTYTNTSGGTSKITCSTCCIQSSTGKCVLKSSLSSPTTQCKTGTF